MASLSANSVALLTNMAFFIWPDMAGAHEGRRRRVYVGKEQPRK